MTLSIIELAKARDMTAGLLDELRLDAYLFELEPRAEQWQLKVDCAVGAEGGWESITLLMPKEMLLLSHTDAAIRRRILAEWRERLAACKRME